MQRLFFRAMGCQMLAVIDSDDAIASELIAQVPGWFEEWEASLSRFRDDSELSALNRSEGKPPFFGSIAIFTCDGLSSIRKNKKTLSTRTLRE